MPFSMLLNDDIVDIEKSDRICSLIFVVYKLSGLFLHPSVLSSKHSRFAEIKMVLYQIFDIDEILIC